MSKVVFKGTRRALTKNLKVHWWERKLLRVKGHFYEYYNSN